MTGERTIQILKTELECVNRQGTPKCNRDCLNCDLLLPAKDVREAYETTIKVLEIVKKQQDAKRDAENMARIRKEKPEQQTGGEG